jgi:hypothetical protein
MSSSKVDWPEIYTRDQYNHQQKLKNGFKINEYTGCWEWQGAADPDGYGAIRWKGKKRNTHKVMYEYLVGEIPNHDDGRPYDLDHLCRNRICCNPEHLEPVTRTVNTRRGDAGKRRG